MSDVVSYRGARGAEQEQTLVSLYLDTSFSKYSGKIGQTSKLGRNMNAHTHTHTFLRVQM